MHRNKPSLYLRLGGYAVTTTVLCLLTLFLSSSSLDPLVQAMALFFYLASIVTLAVVIRHQFHHREEAAPSRQISEVNSPSELTEGQSSIEVCSDQTTAQTTATNESVTDYPSPTACLLLTRHSQTMSAVKACFTAWDRDLITAGSSAEASQKLLNLLQNSHNLRVVTLLIDTAELEIDPIHLPALIKQETNQVALRLIGIVDQQQSLRISQLQDAGYSAFITKPIDKSQLFSTVNSAQTKADQDPNVVDLASYRQKTERRSRKRILVADKNSSDRKRLALLLRDSGHRVKLVENGEQALDALERQRYDIALISLELPIMSGTQVIKLHRFTTPHAQWVSFIIMTAQTTPATLRTCRELQVRACLFKPVPTDTLVELIDAAPVISLPAPATVEQARATPPQHHETQFLNAELLDTQVLKGLEHLDNDNDFVPDLIAIFSRDSSAILQRMEESVEFQDTKHFVELSNVLMDNAGQLGAFALYETCLALQRMRPEELNAILPTKLARLRDLIDRTSHAFQLYLKERENQHSDLS
jgi:two-component system sensor histidine kinase RpfC